MSIGPASDRLRLGLVAHPREVGQRQHHHADHGQEHAEVERHGRGELDLAHQRQVEIVVAAGEEGHIAEPGADTGEPGQQHAQADQRVVVDPQLLLRPGVAAGHVLHDQRHADHQAGDEAAARHVVAAQQDVDADGQRQRQQRPGDHDQHQRMPVARLAPMRQVPQPFTGRPRQRAVQQREDRQCRDAQHGDLAEGVVAAEIDQDHVDHVGAAAARLGLRDLPGGDGLGEIARQHGIERDADGESACGRHHEIAPVPQAGRLGRGLLRQVVERQQHQDGGDDLDRELGQGEVGGGEVDEGQRDNEADDAGQDQGQQALAVVAEDRQGGGHDEQPDGDGRQVHRQSGTRARGMRPAQESVGAHAQHHQDREQQAPRAASRCGWRRSDARATVTSASIRPSKIDLASGRGNARRSASAGR